jgi:hypothetical protein
VHQTIAVNPEEWDWSRVVVDHLDLHASRFSESVRFYESPRLLRRVSARPGRKQRRGALS